MGPNQVNLIPNKFGRLLLVDLVYVDTALKFSVIKSNTLVLPNNSFHPALEKTVKIIVYLLDNGHYSVLKAKYATYDFNLA